jgi:hypothetical protein
MNAIAEKRSTRAVKKSVRASRWIDEINSNRGRARNALVENEDRIRLATLGVLGRGCATKSILLAAVYVSLGCPGKRVRKKIRAAVEIVLAKLYLEGVLYVPDAQTKNIPRHRRNLDRQRMASMIYLRPTNDIPVNRIAASVIGPVWGTTTNLL